VGLTSLGVYDCAILCKAKETLSATIPVLAVTLLWAAMTHAALAAAPASAVVSVADGPPFVLIRGTLVRTATRGAYLGPGDLIESKPGSLLMLEFSAGTAVGAIVAIGPSTRAYWMEGRSVATLAVLEGWIKVDTVSSAQGTDFRTVGRRLGAASGAGVYVLHAGDEVDEVFHESGVMTLWVQKPDGSGTSASSGPSEFTSRSKTSAAQTRLGPGAAFLSTLPAAFRDPLPVGMSAKLRGKTEPQAIRDVAYEDVADWLAAPRDWRRGFIERFRPRLKDPAFFHALDAHMSAHPEWNHILHPPPPPAAAPL
jgi:hypothetical protein